MKSSIKSGKHAPLAALAAAGVFVLSGSINLSEAQAQSAAPPAQASNQAGGAGKSGGSSQFVANRVPAQEQMYYQSMWGIDSLKVKYTESGEMIRFSWRVTNAAKATPLNDKKSEPYLYDPQAGVKLSVPVMEKVGQLRQSSTPIEGKSYWMAFSNSGRRVRPGDRVSLEIGHFRAINLVVE